MEDGQVWGHPIYDWDNHRKENYRWWISRLSFLIELVDLVRFDHFNGILRYWEIPVDHANGRDGNWVNGPGKN